MVFFDAPASWPRAKALLDEAEDELGGAFENRTHLNGFFNGIITPASNAWAYAPSGKASTSATRGLLFELEFGVPNTVKVTIPGDQNTAAGMHATVDARVFRQLSGRADLSSLAGYIRETTFIAVVRNPVTRIWSAFRYLCQSNELAREQFAADRIRLTAITGFDWTRDTGTRAGFEKFLDYIAVTLERDTGQLPNRHWRPQWMNVRPDLFLPDILGRTEAMGEFARALSERFGKDLPETVPRLNEGPPAEMPSWMEEPSVMGRVRTVFERDFEAFGY